MIDFDWPLFTRNVIYGFGSAAAGAAGVLALRRLWSFIHVRKRVKLFQASFAGGVCISMFIIMVKVIQPIPRVPADKWAFWFSVAMVMMFFGAIGIIWELMFHSDEAEEEVGP